MTFEDTIRSIVREAVREGLREELPRLMREVPAGDPDAPLSPEAAARIAGCTAETIRRAVRAKELRAAKHGRRVLLEREDVLRWRGRGTGAQVLDLKAAAGQALARARGAR